MTPEQLAEIEKTAAERQASMNHPPLNHLTVDDLDRRIKLIEPKVFGEDKPEPKPEPEQSNG